jgi:hypothetical protein
MLTGAVEALYHLLQKRDGECCESSAQGQKNGRYSTDNDGKNALSYAAVKG